MFRRGRFTTDNHLFNEDQNKTSQLVLITYISDREFKKIKKFLKAEIKKIKYYSLYIILRKINSILIGISRYYSFTGNRSRLEYLKHYVDKVF